MEVSHSVKERTISENSLIILLQGLQGQVTTVDLRDESVAHGRIDNVDAFMNIRLAQVTYTDRWGHQVELDDLFVTGRNVRYVHIPDNVNITATIEQQLQVIHRPRGDRLLRCDELVGSLPTLPLSQTFPTCLQMLPH
uniref:U7 snRNA-associated Sm-like protein LSm10 n=1 Tax=Bos taurus TaxID=9913 RepID=A0AAA9SXB9_BOVIN